MSRIDLYTMPHKALRAAMASVGVRLGAAGPTPDGDVVAAVHEVLDDLAGHAAHEEAFIDPVLERFVPDLARQVAAQHVELAATVAAVRGQLDRLHGEGGRGASTAPLALYRSFQRLAAANLLHLDHEESVVLPALWLAAPDAELAEVMAAFRAAHPEAVALYHRWPHALAATERQLVGL